MPSVPFTIPCLYAGLGDCHGLLRGEGDGLRLEFQLQDNVLGFFRGRPRQIHVPLRELEAVELQRGWFKHALVIRAKSLSAVAAVPGSRQGRVELRIAHADLPAAEQMVASLYE